MLTNLCSDTFDSIPLAMAPEWRASKCEILDRDGAWRPVKATLSGDERNVSATLALMAPVVLRFTEQA